MSTQFWLGFDMGILVGTMCSVAGFALGRWTERRRLERLRLTEIIEREGY